MKIQVFGVGHIGSALCEALKAQGHEVLGYTHADVDVVVDEIPLPIEEEVDAVYYLVGHCPPGGFKEAISRAISVLDPCGLGEELDRHVIGPLRVFQATLPAVKDGGRYVFISSAATRLLAMPLEKRPPQIQIYHHLTAISGLDALVEGMRMDPEVGKRRIKIHRVCPPAIKDSPFHQGGPPLPTTVSTAEVVAALIDCLSAEDHQDKNLVPPPPVPAGAK